MLFTFIVVTFLLSLANHVLSMTPFKVGVRPQQRSSSPIPIIFKEKPNQGRLFRVKEKPGCADIGENEGFCIEDPDYDAVIQQRFDELLRNSPINNIVTDILNETIIPPELGVPVLRVGGFTSEQTPCLSTETIIYPKRGQTASNDWVYILQGSVQQGVKVEKCLRPGQPCQFGGSGLPNTTCRQKYIYKKLLTMNSRGSNIVSESVYLPSCCVCYVSSEFVPRSGLPRCLNNGA